jgi:hypothetical protein
MYLRSDYPLSTGYQLLDVVARLREAYEQQSAHQEITCSYRQWLEAMLDQMERSAEPKRAY